jgi:hypothetical protein
MQEKFPKKKPAIECSLDQLTIGDSDRISVICNILSLNRELLEGIVSDGTREARIFFKDNEAMNACKEGMTVRLLGKPSVSAEGIQINIDFIQGIEGIDLQAYKKAMSLEKQYYQQSL